MERSRCGKRSECAAGQYNAENTDKLVGSATINKVDALPQRFYFARRKRCNGPIGNAEAVSE